MPTSSLRCFFLQIHFLSPSSHTMSLDRSSGKDRGYAIRAIRHWMQVRFGPIWAPKKVLRSLTYCSQVVPTLIDNWWYNIGNLKLSPPCVLCVFCFSNWNYLGSAGDNKHLNYIYSDMPLSLRFGCFQVRGFQGGSGDGLAAEWEFLNYPKMPIVFCVLFVWW